MAMRSLAALALLAVARAFSSPASSARSTRMFDDSGDSAAWDLDQLSRQSAFEAAAPKFEPSKQALSRKAPRQAGWFPLRLAPEQLDGSMAGDAGFDPLNLSEGRGRLAYMKEAEVKHARLAMLAAAGWPMSELWHREIASALGLESILAAEDRAPSVLNGGLVNGWIFGVAAFTIALSAALELRGMEMSKREGHRPGDFGFDPLGLHSFRVAFWIDRIAENLTREEKLVRSKFDMEVCEIKNGRVAMLGITGMCMLKIRYYSHKSCASIKLFARLFLLILPENECSN